MNIKTVMKYTMKVKGLLSYEMQACGLNQSALLYYIIDHFTRCKQHWSRSTSCFSFL